MFRYFLLLAFIIVFIIPAYADSIEDLEQAITQNPGDLTARKQLAVSYYERGDLNQAIIQLESLIQLAPKDIDVARSLMAAHRMVSLKLQAQKEYPEALGHADKSIALARRITESTAPIPSFTRKT